MANDLSTCPSERVIFVHDHHRTSHKLNFSNFRSRLLLYLRLFNLTDWISQFSIFLLIDFYSNFIIIVSFRVLCNVFLNWVVLEFLYNWVDSIIIWWPEKSKSLLSDLRWWRFCLDLKHFLVIYSFLFFLFLFYQFNLLLIFLLTILNHRYTSLLEADRAREAKISNSFEDSYFKSIIFVFIFFFLTWRLFKILEENCQKEIKENQVSKNEQEHEVNNG